MSNGNALSSPGPPVILNPLGPGQLTPAAAVAGLASSDSPLLDNRPSKAQIVNNSSGGVRLYTTDVFSKDANGNLVTTYNPFIGNPQAGRIRAFCVIRVGGVDITNRLEPYLISVRVIQRSLLTAEIEVDDRDARLPIPPHDAVVEIQLGWLNEKSGLLFSGLVSEVEYSFARQGGRHMTVHCFGLSMTNAIKEPGHDNLGEGAPPGQNEGIPHSLAEWLQNQAAMSGVTIDYMTPKAVQFKRDHWDRNGESFMQLVSRECEKHGLFPFWHEGQRLTVMAFTESPVKIIAQAANNLISLRVRPYVSRGVYNADEQHYFDTQLGQWKRLKIGNNFDPMVDAASGVIANALHPAPAASRMEAQDDAAGGAELAGTNTGHGRICINGEPGARYMCHVQVVDVRPGVNGDYIAADAVEHIYSRQGYITWLDVHTDPYAGASTNALYGYLADAISALPLPAISYGFPGTQVVPVPQLPSVLDPTGFAPTGILDPGISPSVPPVGTITDLPPEGAGLTPIDLAPLAVVGGFL